MTERIEGTLKWLIHELPEGLVVDAAWLSKHRFSTSLRSQYVARGWLEQPARRVYRRPPPLPPHDSRAGSAALSWQQVVVSLQTLLDLPLIVGGRMALDLHGYAHHLRHDVACVHLYGPSRPPTWLDELPVKTRLVYRNSSRLFHDRIARGLTGARLNVRSREVSPPSDGAWSGTAMPWGQWDWPMTLSTRERAVIELIDELPRHESFHQVDEIMAGLTDLSPRRLQKLLADCRSVKAKRLFFFFAARHRHAWFKRLDHSAVDLGTGNRMLVRGGKLDPTYKITVPGDLDGVR